MKQRKFNLLYLLLMAVFVLSSCSKSSQKSAKFIPDNAVVISIDVKQMLEKGKIADNAEAKKKLLESIEQGAKNQETKDLFKKIVDDPTKGGVDLSEPLFLFATADSKDMGIVGSILDKGDFTEVLNTVGKEAGSVAVKEKDGFQYWESDGTVIVFDDATFFASESKKLDDAIAKFKNDDTKGTMAESDDFGKLADNKGFIKALIPMAIAEGQIGDAKSMLPEGAELKDLSIILDLSTSKGEAKLAFECIAKSDAWKKYIKESSEISGKIDGDYLKFLPKGAIMMYANFNGKKLFEMLDKKGLFKKAGMEGQVDIAKKIIETIDGDFALGVGEIKGSMPQVAAYLKTKDQAITDLVKEQGLKPGDQGVDFGYKDGATYIAVGTDAFKEASAKFDKSVVSGRRFYMFCDVELIAGLAGMINGQAAEGAKSASEVIKTAELYDTSDTEGELILKFKDADKDPIEFFIDMALKNM
ncbi:MAG: DUF4836 family protein [Prevotella sp.]|nr:DUF4836 family protein [Prevotella sp.]